MCSISKCLIKYMPDQSASYKNFKRSLQFRGWTPVIEPPDTGLMLLRGGC
jgi:hypothetical protein